MAYQSPGRGNERDIDKLISLINDLGPYANGGNKRYNYNPIFHRPLSQHVGIAVRGEFRTDDGTDNGRVSYVTVLRNSPSSLGNRVVVYDGLGLAWRKQPNTVIKGDTANYEYNVFLVDNDALDESVYISQNTVVQDYGVNNFVTAAKLYITTNTWYSFRLVINENMGINCWIWESSAAEPDFNTITPDIQYGVQFPKYTPIAAGSHFGLSVMETGGFLWWYRNITVTSIIESTPGFLFRIYAPPSIFNSDDDFSIRWRGIGKGPEPNSTDTGASVWIRQRTPTDAWIKLGDEYAQEADDPSNQTILTSLTDGISNYTDYRDFIDILTLPINSGITHTLRTYYTSLEPSIPSGVHLGNMEDIYVNAPSRIMQATLTIPAGAATVLEATPGISVPIQEVVSVQPTGVPDTWYRGIDYNIIQSDINTAWSNQAKTTLTINTTLYAVPINIDVTYRYYLDGTAIQNTVNSEEYRYAGIDNLIKISPPVVVEVQRFSYSNGVAEADMRSKFSAFVNSGITDDRLEISDLINLAYDNGATFVDTGNIRIGYRQYDLDGTLNSGIINSYFTLSGLNQFYTQPSEMAGLLRI